MIKNLNTGLVEIDTYINTERVGLFRLRPHEMLTLKRFAKTAWPFWFTNRAYGFVSDTVKIFVYVADKTPAIVPTTLANAAPVLVRGLDQERFIPYPPIPTTFVTKKTFYLKHAQ